MSLQSGTASSLNINKPEIKFPPPMLYFLGRNLTAGIPSKIAPRSDSPAKARYVNGFELKYYHLDVKLNNFFN